MASCLALGAVFPLTPPPVCRILHLDQMGPSAACAPRIGTRHYNWLYGVCAIPFLFNPTGSARLGNLFRFIVQLFRRPAVPGSVVGGLDFLGPEPWHGWR